MQEVTTSQSALEQISTNKPHGLFKQLLEFASEQHEIAPWVIDVSDAKVTLLSNNQMADFFGLSPGAFEQQFTIEDTISIFNNMMSKDNVDEVLDKFYGVIDGRYPAYDVVYKLIDGKGNRRWISATSSKVERDADGKVIRILGIHQDVSKEYEQKLYIDDVFNSSDDIIFTTDLKHISQSNQEFANIFQSCINFAEVLQCIRLFSIRNNTLKDRKINQQFIENNMNKTVNVQLNHDGIIAYYALRIVRLTGKCNEYLLRFKKITEQIHHSSDLRKAQSVFEHASEGITFTDAHCNVISINQAFTEITGYQENEIIGKNPRILRSEQQDDSFYIKMWDDIIEKGFWKGEICNRHKHGHDYYEMLTITSIYNDAGELTNYVGIFSDITLQKRQKEALEHLAHYDQLTSLANRALLSKRLSQAIHSQKAFGVLYIDLDGFKEVNDSHGHSAGDQLLVQLAKRFQSSVRQQDTVARIGGDEFVIILEDISDYGHCLQAVERLLRQAAAPVYIRDKTLQVTASIGATFQYRDDGKPLCIDILLKQADYAMYFAKRSGKNCFKLYEPGMEDELHLGSFQDKHLVEYGEMASSMEISEIEKRNAIRTKVLEYLVKNIPLQDVLLKIIEGVEMDYPGMKCSILQLDETGRYLGNGVAPSLPAFYNSAIDGVEIGVNIGSCGHAAATGERVIVEDIQNHPNWAGFTEMAEKAGLGACWSEPIIGSEGHVLGTFAIYHSDKTIPVDDDFELIHMSAHLAALAIEKHFANKALWQSLNFDPLTKLPNKNLFTEHVKSAITQHQTNMALLHIDIRQFHRVNHCYGFDAGDELLVQIGQRLQELVPEEGHLSRINGDEFVVLRRGSLHAINQFAHQLATRLREPFIHGKESVHLESCIGISLLNDDEGSVTEHFNNASKALLEHKSSQFGDYYHFDQSMQNKANERIQLERDLRKAIELDQFYLEYQPIYDVNSNELVKAEALLRWLHPKRGVIMPEVFIPVAEETRLIVDIGELVFNKAHAMVKRWRERFNPDFKISINTSVVQYQSKNALAETWINEHNAVTDKKHGLIIELTETVLQDDHQHISYQLMKLKQAGFEIALDDFGTGYSSLAYLQKFKFDYLKIDRSFISHIDVTQENNVLCQTIVMMAKNLGIQVIAEGVESGNQLATLRQMNAEFAQGFHFSKPISWQLFEKLFFVSPQATQ